MVCSNCGYENPAVHRFCGMCGSPFPRRIASVPQEQGALAFTSAPPEMEPEPWLAHEVAPPVVEPEAVLPAETATPATVATEVETSLAEATVQAREQIERVAAPEPVIEMAAPAFEAKEPEVEAAESVVEPEPAPAWHQQQLIEAEATEVVAAEVAQEPAPFETELPEAGGTEDQPEVAEDIPKPAAQEPKAEEAPAVAAKPTEEETTTPAEAESKPTPRVVVMPKPPLRPLRVERTEQPPPKPGVTHPTPDTLPYSPPPASAGMPTFQEIQDAAGAPPISPFEPPGEKQPDEDRELKEFVASFQWTPPLETADELTMRSEVPVIDKAEPAVFHHPSFDDDVPPPPEEAHPTGEEYYRPAHAGARAKFLEISETPSALAASAGDFAAAMEEEASPATPTKWWLWTSVAGVILVFGVLGFLQGRAESTHAFRGPVDILKDEYHGVRQWLAKVIEASPAPPKAKTNEVTKRLAPSSGEKQTETEGATGNTSDQPTATTPETSAPQQSASTSADQSGGASDVGPRPGTANAATPKPIEAPPPPKASAKPQPGQEELARAMNASDATAAAAWLWKSTSRGNPDAPVRLADMYIKGNGVPKSCEQALVLLRSAAAKENAPARNRLAALYANGTCVACDRVKAYQLMSSALAADPSSDWAKENRQRLWNQMTPQERTEAQKTQ